MKINEAKAIASAVRLDEIPPQYKKLPLLGRGATSITFAKDAHTVLMFTRDVIKRDWVRDGLRLARADQIINPVRLHHIKDMSDVPLYMIEMPRLYPLNAANRKKVIQEIKAFVKHSQETKLMDPKAWPQSLVRMIDIYHDQHPHSQVLGLLEWIMNYDPDQFRWDLSARQFMQTAQGELVLLDPVVSAELWDLFMTHLKRRYL